jgi:hypothetical protein
MKHTLLSYTIALFLSGLLIFLSYFLPASNSKEKPNDYGGNPYAKKISKKIMDSLKQYDTKKYQLLVLEIKDHSDNKLIDDENILKLNQQLDNTYCGLVAVAIENFVKTQQNSVGLDVITTELDNLKNITDDALPVKQSTIKLANSFKSALSALDVLNSFITHSMYDGGRANIMRSNLKKIEAIKILNENQFLVTNANIGLLNLDHFMHVDQTYINSKDLTSKSFLPSQDPEKLAQDGESGPVFPWYKKQFEDLVNKLPN